MNHSIKKYFAIIVLVALAPLSALIYAADYIAVAKDGNIYDMANAKYATENQNGQEVAIIPGMVFNTSEHTPGWYKVEYSPGLHAYLPEQIVASSLTPLTPGNYKVNNNPSQTIILSKEGNEWIATTNSKTYKGIDHEGIVIFFDENNNIIYSLVNLGDGPIAITYDNSVTKFF